MKAVKRRYYLIFKLQRSILGPILLNVFIIGLNDGWDEAHPQQICRWYKNRTGAWYTKWLNCCSAGCGEAGGLGSPEAEQREKPNPAFGEEETLGTHPCRLGSVWLESSFAEKASGLLVDRKWKINQHPWCKGGQQHLCCIRKSFTSQLRVILLCLTLAWAHLEYFVVVSASHNSGPLIDFARH